MLTYFFSGGGDQFGFLTRCNLPVWDKPQHHHHILVVFVVVVDIFVVDMSVVDGDIAVFVDVSIDNYVHSGDYISVLVDVMNADVDVDKSADDDSSADHYSRNMNDVDDFRFSHDAQDLGEELSDGL